MAITTQDGVVAALAGGQIRALVKNALAGTFNASGSVSLWTASGMPSAGAAAGSAAGAVCTSATVGAISYTNPTNPALSYLGRWMGSASVIGYLVLYDRLVHSSALSGTVTTAQTIGTPALTRPDATGANVEAWMEVYAALGSTSTTFTWSYTNSAGTASRSSAIVVPASVPAGYMQMIPWVSGDTGVQSVQSVTLTASTLTAGNFGVTLLRRLCEIPIIVAGGAVAMDWGLTGIPRIYDNACIAAMFNPAGTAAPAIGGSITIAQG